MTTKLCVQFMVAFALTVGQSRAEPVAEPVKQARQRFDEGVEAVDAGDFERARVAFEQAYLLKPAPEVLKNLGLAEVDAGHTLEGARHLAEWLRRFAPRHPNEERASVEQVLRRVESQLGRLKVSTGDDSETVIVGRDIVDRGAARDVWHVEPGRHDVTVRSASDSQAKTVTVAPGELVVVDFKTEPDTSASQGLSVNSPAAPQDEQTSSARTATVLVGAGLTATAIGLATAFSLEARSDQKQIEQLRSTVGGGDSACTHAHDSTCEQLKRTLEDRDKASTIAISGWIAASVLGGATVATWLLWPDREDIETAQVTPSLSPYYAGVLVQGAF